MKEEGEEVQEKEDEKDADDDETKSLREKNNNFDINSKDCHGTESNHGVNYQADKKKMMVSSATTQ